MGLLPVLWVCFLWQWIPAYSSGIFYQIQSLIFRVLDPFGKEFCIESKIRISCLSSTCYYPIWLALFVEPAVFSSVCIYGFSVKAMMAMEVSFICGSSSVSYWSVSLFLCQYYVVLIIIALYNNFKSKNVIPAAVFNYYYCCCYCYHYHYF